MTSPAPSDALVFFGATGDLAHKKVFPALQALVKEGALKVPVDRRCRRLGAPDGCAVRRSS